MNPIFESLGVTVLERGWLSSNCTVICDELSGWVIDTGYATHATQTAELVRRTLGHRTLVGLINTHLHSDHCGGNATLQEHFAGVQTWIPPGLSHAVREWDTVTLSYEPTGQICPRFEFNHLLKSGTTIPLGGSSWEVHAAPGHDPHAVVLFEPEHRVLISGDALWQNGFGVVFPELEGKNAFAEVESTLDLISGLQPRVVIPGHGAPFTDVLPALTRARARLQQFESMPHRHAEYAAKVLVKFHLLEKQNMPLAELARWYESTPYFKLVQAHHPSVDLALPVLVAKLVQSSAARIEGDRVFDA